MPETFKYTSQAYWRPTGVWVSSLSSFHWRSPVVTSDSYMNSYTNSMISGKYMSAGMNNPYSLSIVLAAPIHPVSMMILGLRCSNIDRNKSDTYF